MRRFFCGSIFLLTACSLLLTACGSGSQGSLIGDKQESSTCPSGGCAVTTPTDQNILISSNSPTQVYVKKGQRFEFSGDCSPSTYPSNRLNISIKDSAGNAIAVPLGTTGSTTLPQCINGRFNIALNTTPNPDVLPVNTPFRVVVALEALDDQNAVHRNEGSGVFQFQLILNN